MPGQAGLEQQPPRPVTTSDEPGRPGQQRQRFLGGAVAGGEQLLVEIEERHDVGTIDLVQRRLGPDDEVAPHSPGPELGLGGELDDRAAGQRLELFAGPTDPGAQVLHLRPTAAGAHLGPDRLAAPAAQVAVVALGHRRVAALTHGDLPAGRTAEQPRPALAVQDAQDPGPAAEDLDETGAVAGFGGRQLPGVDDLDARPTGSLGLARRGRQRGGGERLERRSGRDEHAGHVGATGALDGHLAGVPGRRLLLLERLVVLVEHDHRRGSGQRRPGGGAGAEHGGSTGPGDRPLLGQHGHGHAGASQAEPEVAHRPRRRSDHQRRTEARGREEQGVGICGRAGGAGP